MINNKTEKRLYVLVPYNLSDIQKGIQAAHAIAELGHKMYYDNLNDEARGISIKIVKYNDWVENWKTIIILNGGTTGLNSAMARYGQYLGKFNVTMSVFREPDLNDAVTAIAFVLDMEEDSHIVGYLKQMGLA